MSEQHAAGLTDASGPLLAAEPSSLLWHSTCRLHLATDLIDGRNDVAALENPFNVFNTVV